MDPLVYNRVYNRYQARVSRIYTHTCIHTVDRLFRAEFPSQLAVARAHRSSIPVDYPGVGEIIAASCATIS